MLLPARSPTPQVLPEPQGVSVNFLSKEGVLSSSNILRVWNNQLKEIWAPRKACKSRLQRVLPSERTQRSHLPTADPTPQPLAGTAWWGHTGQAWLQGQHTWEKQSEDTGSRQKWLCKRGLYPTGLQGPPGAHPRPEGEKAPLDPAEGRSRRQRTLHGVRQAVKKRINSLHCTHIVNTLTCLFQTRHRHNSSRLPPASNEAVPRLRCSAQAERQTCPQNEDPC